jgi:cytochrome c2
MMAVWIVLTIAVGLLDVASGSAIAADSCVECHQRAETTAAFPAWRKDQFAHWHESAHGRVGVTCDKCHRGNPNRSNKWLAHWGVKASLDPESPTHYKNVPETCGACHEAVYRQFANTLHFKNLKTDRLAPTCTTCHGFEMDVGSVSPSQIALKCTMCHNPEQGATPEVATMARHAVERIAATRDAIAAAQSAIAAARAQGRDPKEAEALLGEAEKRLKGTGALWHSFYLGGFEQRLDGAETLARDATAAAQGGRAHP